MRSLFRHRAQRRVKIARQQPPASVSPPARRRRVSITRITIQYQAPILSFTVVATGLSSEFWWLFICGAWCYMGQGWWRPIKAAVLGRCKEYTRGRTRVGQRWYCPPGPPISWGGDKRGTNLEEIGWVLQFQRGLLLIPEPGVSPARKRSLIFPTVESPAQRESK